MYWYTNTFFIENVSTCRYKYILKVSDTLQYPILKVWLLLGLSIVLSVNYLLKFNLKKSELIFWTLVRYFNRGIFSRSKKWGNGIITNLFQNPFKAFNFDVRKSPQPSLGFVQSLEAVVGNTEILVLRERKTKNWKKWH